MNNRETFQEIIVKDYSQPSCGSSLNWENKTFNNQHCSGNMTRTQNGDIMISGRVNTMGVTKLMYWAAAPPTYSTSFSGSGLPYANPLQAYDRTPNRGTIQLKGNTFQFTIKYPNAYYVGLGSLYVPPHVNIKLCDNNNCGESVSLVVDEGIPFRTLTYPAPPSNKPRNSPLFYCEPSHGARSQEQILRESGYPNQNKMPSNFWGKKPPK
jgi:hypothetical protein